MKFSIERLYKKKNMFKPVFCILIFSMHIQVVACSAFLLNSNNKHIVGMNYDWNIENGRVLINKREVSKTAFGVKNPISWQSKYGSITFNQYGQEFPNGGINERGLVVEALWLDETAYPAVSDSMPQIDNMQWIQFQLDNSSNIEEVIKNDKSVQIRPISATVVHYFVADKTGKSVIIESINGIVHHYLPDSVNLPLLTNDPYDKSIRLMQKCSVFGGNLEIPKGQGSISRFIRMAVETHKYNGNKDAIDESFSILKDVKMFLLTKWSITYDLDNLTVYFKSASSKKIKSVDLNKMNFSCKEPIQFINININENGDITNLFKNYSNRENYELIKESIDKTDFLKYSGKQLIKSLSAYQETINCASQ